MNLLFVCRLILVDMNTTSDDVLNKYERAKILGVRALQISMGSPIMIELKEETNPVDIARRELKEGKMPLVIKFKE